MKVSGIYAIFRVGSVECYVGQSADINQRWHAHRSKFRSGKHEARHMQAVYNKHGADALVFSVIESVTDPDRLTEREQFWMDSMQPVYNAAPAAGSTRGYRHTDQSRALIAEAGMGNTHNFGNRHSAETKSRMSAAHMGNKSNLGKKASNETRLRMSEAHKGNNHCHGNRASSDTKARMSAAQQKRRADERTKKASA